MDGGVRRPSVRLEFDLTVGDIIHVGEHTVMIVEIHGDEVTVKVCTDDGSAPARQNEPQGRPLRPR